MRNRVHAQYDLNYMNQVEAAIQGLGARAAAQAPPAPGMVNVAAVESATPPVIQPPRLESYDHFNYSYYQMLRQVVPESYRNHLYWIKCDQSLRAANTGFMLWMFRGGAGEGGALYRENFGQYNVVCRDEEELKGDAKRLALYQKLKAHSGGSLQLDYNHEHPFMGAMCVQRDRFAHCCGWSEFYGLNTQSWSHYGTDERLEWDGKKLTAVKVGEDIPAGWNQYSISAFKVGRLLRSMLASESHRGAAFAALKLIYATDPNSARYYQAVYGCLDELIGRLGLGELEIHKKVPKNPNSGMHLCNATWYPSPETKDHAALNWKELDKQVAVIVMTHTSKILHSQLMEGLS